MQIYVANKKLKVSNRGGNPSVIDYNPGDIIPDFAQWEESPKRSNLAMDYVRKVDSSDLDEAQLKQLKNLKSVKKVSDSKPVEKAVVDPELTQVALAHAKKEDLEPKLVPSELLPAGEIEDGPINDNSTLNFQCDFFGENEKSCGKKFKSPKALRTHITLAHKKKEA